MADPMSELRDATIEELRAQATWDADARDEMARRLRDLEEAFSAEKVANGLTDARSALKDLWLAHEDPELRKRCRRALEAVIAAERTIKAADAFLLAKTRAERRKTFDDLRDSCLLRLGHEIRKTP